MTVLVSAFGCSTVFACPVDETAIESAAGCHCWTAPRAVGRSHGRSRQALNWKKGVATNKNYCRKGPQTVWGQVWFNMIGHDLTWLNYGQFEFHLGTQRIEYAKMVIWEPFARDSTNPTVDLPDLISQKWWFNLHKCGFATRPTTHENLPNLNGDLTHRASNNQEICIYKEQNWDTWGFRRKHQITDIVGVAFGLGM